MKRREFVGGLAVAAGLAGCAKPEGNCSADASASTQSFEWSCVTSWPPRFPGLGMAVENLAERLDRASGGRLKIKVYGGGELVPPLEVFDAVSRGVVEMGHDASYYQKGKVDAAQFFTAIPFGLNYMELNAWIHYGGGLKLWRELYEPFNFNKEINSINDLNGLKMRIPGLGGDVLRRAGGTPITLPASEIFTSLQTGAIDATEWVGPYNDISLGLHKAARYYYYPGWQEPGPGLECMINREAWDSLPADLQALVEITCQSITIDMAAEYTNGNANALQQLMTDPNVELRAFPDEVLQHMKSITADIVAEMMATDPGLTET